MAAVAKAVVSDLQILGAFEGEHSICCASEDSGKSAWAVDLAGDENEGDDLCDACMRSGVQVSHTKDGNTVCVECAKDAEDDAGALRPVCDFSAGHGKPTQKRWSWFQIDESGYFHVCDKCAVAIDGGSSV